MVQASSRASSMISFVNLPMLQFSSLDVLPVPSFLGHPTVPTTPAEATVPNPSSALTGPIHQSSPLSSISTGAITQTSPPPSAYGSTPQTLPPSSASTEAAPQISPPPSASVPQSSPPSSASIGPAPQTLLPSCASKEAATQTSPPPSASELGTRIFSFFPQLRKPSASFPSAALTPFPSTAHDINPKAFKKLKRLRILIVTVGDFSCNQDHLPSELRWLEWHRYPSSSLPSNFSPSNLVALILPCSGITKLWDGYK
ncbi:hypothetical protein CRG98_040726, partial [Punica granatum]